VLKKSSDINNVAYFIEQVMEQPFISVLLLGLLKINLTKYFFIYPQCVFVMINKLVLM